MSEAVGPMYIRESGGGGGPGGGGGLLSEATKQAVDAEVRALLVGARERVSALLRERLADLQLLSRALMEHETLTSDDIAKVLAGERLAPRPAAAAAGGGGGGGGSGGGGGGGGDAAGKPAAASAEAAAGVALDER
jgi:cell division protease FtsH